MRDQMNNLYPKRAISPVSVADNTAQVSQIIDVAGYEALTFVIDLGSIADSDATFAVTMEHGDDSALADTAVPAAADLVGTTALAAFQFDSDNKLRKIGYKGTKRYVRMTITPTANSSAGLISAVALLGFPTSGPTANPPV
jgi:hypothetical protein